MKIREGFILKKIGDERVILALGAASRYLNGIVKLNDTGAFLWEEIEKGSDRDKLVQTFADKFSISAEQAQKDVDGFLDMLKGANCFED